jgi:hypothetical protein
VGCSPRPRLCRSNSPQTLWWTRLSAVGTGSANGSGSSRISVPLHSPPNVPNACFLGVEQIQGGREWMKPITDFQSDAPNYFLAVDNSACQLRTTVIGGDAASPAGATARKRWPSGMTS